MTLVGWSHGSVEPADLWPPLAAGVALEDNEWGETRGRRDVERCQVKALRLWTRGNPGVGPIGEKARRWSALGHYVQVLNEPDLNVLGDARDANGRKLDVEEFRGGPDEHADYLLSVIRVAGPGHRVGFTPMSPGVGLDILRAWLSGPKTEQALAACVVVFAHVYGDTARMWADLQPVLEGARRHGKPVIVSECAPAGNDPVEPWGAVELPRFLDQVALVALDVLAVCPFAPTWPGDPGFDARRMLGTSVERVLREWRAPTTSQEPRSAPRAAELALVGLPATEATPAPTEGHFARPNHEVTGVTMPELSRAEHVAIVRAAAVRHGVDPDLAEAVGLQESGYDADVIYGRRESEAGAKGILQLMQSTADALGVLNVFSPIDNADGGARYLAEKLRVYRGDVVRSLLAYDGGHGAVQAWEAGDPYRESRDYVRGILGVELGPADPCAIQFGQAFADSLTQEERALGWISSACGPIALAGMLGRLGRPTDPAAVLRWAAAYRHPDGRELWNARQGMVGRDVYEAMETMAARWGVVLTRHSTPADLMEAFDQGGAIISTVAHLFYAIRPSTSDEDILVGNTGNALLKGSAWMSLNEIDREGGGILASWTGVLVEAVAPPRVVHPLDEAAHNIWDALSRLAALDQLRAEEAQRVFADVIKPVLARAKETA